MDVEKARRVSWTIKHSPTEKLTITVTEQNSRLLGVNYSQTEMEMTPVQFQEFLSYLGEIRKIIETKFYFTSETGAEAPILPKRIAPEIPSISVNSVQSHFPVNIPLLPPKQLNIPEIYILSRTGVSLFHFNFKGEVDKQPVDENLVSGLLGAIHLFAENMGWLAGVSLIKAGNIEIRFAKGDMIIVSLVSSVDLNLGYLIEPVLADLATELCGQFESFYFEELRKGNNTGLVDARNFEGFRAEFQDFFIKYRKQVFEIYQKLILTEAIYLEVPVEICSELIHTASEGKNVVAELGDLIAKYPPIQKAIQKVNFAQKPLWDIFGIPLYDV